MNDSRSGSSRASAATSPSTVFRLVLTPQLGGRSDGSIEFKHTNISAVLARQGLAYIEGFKPRGN